MSFAVRARLLERRESLTAIELDKKEQLTDEQYAEYVGEGARARALSSYHSWHPGAADIGGCAQGAQRDSGCAAECRGSEVAWRSQPHGLCASGRWPARREWRG